MPPRFAPARRRFLQTAALCGLSAVGLSNGCTSLLSTAAVELERPGLPPVRVPPQAVQVELLFVERPVNDPLLGSPLWAEMDQIAGIPAPQRLALSENGFRIGFCGSDAPPTLTALLAEVGEDAYDDQAGFLTGQRTALRPGSISEVVTTVEPRDWSIELARDGVLRQRDFERCRGIIRLQLEDVQDGWAAFRITPEIHHGALKTQPTPGPTGWDLSEQQSIEMLTESMFAMRLALGELLVISADDTGSGRAGNQFFRREDHGRLMQRVLVIRVASIDRGREATGT